MGTAEGSIRPLAAGSRCGFIWHVSLAPKHPTFRPPGDPQSSFQAVSTARKELGIKGVAESFWGEVLEVGFRWGFVC